MKTSCGNMSLLISRSLDGDCGPEELAAIEAHVAVCGTCRRTAEQFAAHAALVEASFSDAPLPVSAVKAFGRRDTGLRMAMRLPVWATVRWVGACAAVALILTVLLLRNANGPDSGVPAVVIESPTPSTMSLPLSSIIYYEEYAGKTVHSQFVRISPEYADTVPSTVRERLSESAYNSPLFADAIIAVSAVLPGAGEE